ncbi:MAG: glycosyltransferase family A protein [Methylococcales bacterium]
MAKFPNLGAVAIGRNEGERLKQCLQSIIPQVVYIVYVDSGSSDGSLEFANSLGVATVALDDFAPFTAARARNAGFERLLEINPNLEFIQFVDGDCELVAGWLRHATEALQSDPKLAVVCGRRREKFPYATLYNLLCELEWDIPAGNVKESTGDALMRTIAVKQVNGYNDRLIAGEDPELCIRLRQAGWKILRLNSEMTLHDADMTHFKQWWKRSQRAGYAFAEGAWMYGQSPEKHWLKESRKIWLWGLGIPSLVVIGIAVVGSWGLLLLLGYLVSLGKTFHFYSSYGWSFREKLLYSAFCVFAKLPQVLGQLQFHVNRLLGRKALLIEYKLPD